MATTAAFFDVDGTLFDGLSMASLLHFVLEELETGLASRLLQLEQDAALAASRRQLTTDFFRLMAGQSWSQMIAWGQHWYDGVGRTRLIPEVVDRLREHHERGEAVVFVSGSWPPCLLPIARDLSVDYVYCCEAGVEADILTGQVLTMPFAEAKAAILRRFSANHGVHLADSYAYGDDESDTPMLAAVGNAIAVNPSPALAQTAGNRGWQILMPEHR